MVWQNMGKNVTEGQIYIIENKMVCYDGFERMLNRTDSK